MCSAKVDKATNAIYIKTNGDAMQKEQLASVEFVDKSPLKVSSLSIGLLYALSLK